MQTYSPMRWPSSLAPHTHDRQFWQLSGRVQMWSTPTASLMISRKLGNCASRPGSGSQTNAQCTRETFSVGSCIQATSICGTKSAKCCCHVGNEFAGPDLTASTGRDVLSGANAASFCRQFSRETLLVGRGRAQRGPRRNSGAGGRGHRGRRLCRALGGADLAPARARGAGAGCRAHRVGRVVAQRRHGVGRPETGRRGAGATVWGGPGPCHRRSGGRLVPVHRAGDRRRKHRSATTCAAGVSCPPGRRAILPNWRRRRDTSRQSPACPRAWCRASASARNSGRITTPAAWLWRRPVRCIPASTRADSLKRRAVPVRRWPSGVRVSSIVPRSGRFHGAHVAGRPVCGKRAGGDQRLFAEPRRHRSALARAQRSCRSPATSSRPSRSARSGSGNCFRRCAWSPTPSAC